MSLESIKLYYDVLKEFDIPISEDVLNDVQKLYRPVLQLETYPKYKYEQSGNVKEYVFWERERHRFKHGWVAPDGKFINGMYYLYLNHLKINFAEDDDSTTVKMGSPLYFKEDNDLFDLVWFSRSKGLKIPAKKIVATKGRQQHFSENIHSGILIWYLLINRGRNVGVIYPDDTSKRQTIIKFKRSLATAPEELFYPFYPSVDKMNYIRRAQGKAFNRSNLLFPNSNNTIGLVKLEEGEKLPICNVQFVSSDGKSVGLVGGSFDFIAIDEGGKYKNGLTTILGLIDDTLGQLDERFGVLLLGGTTDTITNESRDFVNILLNHKELGWKLYFLEAWRMRKGHFNPKTGESDKETGTAMVLAAHEKAAKESEMALRLKRQEQPLTLEHAIGMSNFGELPSSDMEGMLAYISINGLSKKPFMVRGRFERKVNLVGEKTWDINFVEDEYGYWEILSIVPNNKYDFLDVMAVDDFYSEQVSRVDKNTSRGCAIIYRRNVQDDLITESDYPIALYYGREKRSEFHEQLLMASIYFKLSKRCVVTEYNDSGLYSYFEHEGYDDLVFFNNGLSGIVVKDREKSRANVLALSYFEQGRFKRNYFSTFWKEMLKVDSRNNDVKSAFYVLLLFLDMFRYEVKIRVAKDDNKLFLNSNINYIDLKPRLQFFNEKTEEHGVFDRR